MEAFDEIHSEPESPTSDANRETDDVITDMLPVPENITASSAHSHVDPSSPVTQNTLGSSEHFAPSSSPMQYSSDSDSEDDVPLANR
jgi:hypothetical protein